MGHLSEEKKRKKLGTYVICLILSVIILIIFAAMADHREEHFENEIHEKEKLNLTIQNQIVSLTDENYLLKQEAENYQQEIEKNKEIISSSQSLLKAWTLFSNQDLVGAKEIFSQIDQEKLNEEQKENYDALKKALK